MTKTIWLVGAGPMAVEYAKVLKHLGHTLTVIGRSADSAKAFEEATGVAACTGGLAAFIADAPGTPDAAIVATGVEALYENSALLLEHGVKHLLVEKPGAMTRHELEQLEALAKRQQAKAYIAYNRRFYASVQKAREMIEADGGVQTFQFEFTEWSHVIGTLKKAEGVKPAWFLMNSTHVADIAFFLGGRPTTLNSYCAGGLDWHPASSQFAGAGVTDHKALFTYNANWQAPGRWGLELQTAERRYIFRPLEKLHVMEKGSVAVTEVDLGEDLDTRFKAGLYRQVVAFLDQQPRDLCSVEEQLSIWDTYSRIAGYA